MSYPRAVILLFLLPCLAALVASCQTSPSSPASTPREQTAPSTAEAQAPRLELKDIKPVAPVPVAPVIDGDLPQEFLDIFKDSKDCSGITFYTRDKKTPPDFRVRMTLSESDTPDQEQEWLWTVLDAKRGGNDELRGIGNQTSAVLAVQDMCTTVWEGIDPNHYKKPGPKK
ncbi:MAG TPA: hypothetical protein VE422_27200 [Terriglobia bacterium]|nr:hypothetical protein [Terriglobia bacterium]